MVVDFRVIVLVISLACITFSTSVTADIIQSDNCSTTYSILLEELAVLRNELNTIDYKNIVLDVNWLKVMHEKIRQGHKNLSNCQNYLDVNKRLDAEFLVVLVEKDIMLNLKKLFKYENMQRSDVLKALMSIKVNISGVLGNVSEYKYNKNLVIIEKEIWAI